jgi:hypothetical protein
MTAPSKKRAGRTVDVTELAAEILMADPSLLAEFAATAARG